MSSWISAAAWPLPVRAQPQNLPLVGFLSSWTADTNQRFRQAFRDGVKDEGFVEGQNVAIEYRQVEADGYDQCQRWRLTSLLGEWPCFSHRDPGGNGSSGTYSHRFCDRQ